MKPSTKCPCNDLKCRQLQLIHEQIERSYMALQRIARATTQDEQLADDLLQQFCMNLLARPHNFIPGSNFIALGRISIKRLYLNCFRNKRIMTPANSQSYEKTDRLIESGGQGVQASHQESYRDVELLDLINAMCDALSNELEQAVFSMHFIGYTGREIAEHLSMNVNTIHGMIRRIRRKLLEQFKDECAS